MFLLVLGYNWYTGVNAEDIVTPTENAAVDSVNVATEAPAPAETASFQPATEPNDSLANVRKMAELTGRFGSFAPSAEGENERFTLKNSRVMVTVHSKGGWFTSATLVNGYKTYWDTASVPLFNPDRSKIDLWLDYPGKGLINTSDLYFTKVREGQTAEGSELVLRLTTDRSDAYLEYRYLLANDGYTVDVDVNAVGLNTLVNLETARLDWTAAGQHLESASTHRYSTVRWNADVTTSAKAAKTKKRLSAT